MGWKMEVLVEGEWASNALVFETEREALLAGAELLSRWWVPIASRAVETDKEVNYRFVDGRPVSLERIRQQEGP